MSNDWKDFKNSKPDPLKYVWIFTSVGEIGIAYRFRGNHWSFAMLSDCRADVTMWKEIEVPLPPLDTDIPNTV